MASPVCHVTPESPPILTFHGSADFLVSVANAQELDKVLEKAGTVHRTFIIEGWGHPPFGWVGPTFRVIELAMVAFFTEHLKDDEVAWHRLKTGLAVLSG
jgi:fermentation-respiration switch protein FrsA (DUF1100 family)